MADDTLVRTGARIRERRLDRGIRQADLALAVGISPSYLNLIEHNRRRIAGGLLTQIAQALDIEPALLTQGAERAVLDQLRAAGAVFSQAHAELARTEEMAARYPGWAAVIAAQATRLAALEAQVQMLSDRMAYDPALATSLHEVISSVTSIRSTAAILTSEEPVDADWQRRFHRNIHDDAVRLAASSDALMAYLEAPDETAGPQHTPVEEVEAWLETRGYHLPALETGGTAEAAMSEATALRPAARHLLRDHLDRYIRDARALPMGDLAAAATRTGPDAFALARGLGVDPALVMRRLAALPTGAGLPPVGLAICDAGGFLRFVRSVPGFVIPRSGACPLWPLFTALGQVGRGVSGDVTLPGGPETRLRCAAVSRQVNAADDQSPPVIEATMIARPDPPPDEGPLLPIGVACRICPRAECAARREPSALGAGL